MPVVDNQLHVQNFLWNKKKRAKRLADGKCNMKHKNKNKIILLIKNYYSVTINVRLFHIAQAGRLIGKEDTETMY